MLSTTPLIKAKKYHTVEIVPKSNRDRRNRQIQNSWHTNTWTLTFLAWYSISLNRSGGIKLVCKKGDGSKRTLETTQHCTQTTNQVCLTYNNSTYKGHSSIKLEELYILFFV